MNTEEKAKAYDEALEMAKNALQADLHESGIWAIKRIFPELKESEEERIRKEIIHYILYKADGVSEEQEHAWITYLEKQKEFPFVKDVVLGCPGLYFYDGERMHFRGPVMEEKQKEQKPILEVFGFKVGDAVRLKDGDGRKHIIKSFEEVEGLHGPNFYHVEFEDNSAKSGIYPGEEYPNGYYTQMEKFEEEQEPAVSREEILHQLFQNGSITLFDYLYLTEKQKPAEKRDYSGLNDLEGAIHRGFLSAGVENVPVKIIKETAQECLAQMKPAEWSEEDEIRKESCMLYLANTRDVIEFSQHIGDNARKSGKNEIQKDIDWLKSLRPSWKPTKEQMQYLLAVINDPNNIGAESCYLTLKSLYDDLKKFQP